MKPHMSELKRDVRIDPLQLDVECLQQSELFIKWAEKAAEAREAMDEAKKILDETEGDLQMQARQDPEAFGLEKVTEKGVEFAATQHKLYRKRRAEHLEAKSLSMSMSYAVSAMEMKKKMLESMINLFGLQYFAGPKEPRDIGKKWKARQEASEKKLNARIKKKIRRRKKK